MCIFFVFYWPENDIRHDSNAQYFHFGRAVLFSFFGPVSAAVCSIILALVRTFLFHMFSCPISHLIHFCIMSTFIVHRFGPSFKLNLSNLVNECRELGPITFNCNQKYCFRASILDMKQQQQKRNGENERKEWISKRGKKEDKQEIASKGEKEEE